MFYGIRGPETLINIAFQHANTTRDGIQASAKFTDKDLNRWKVTFQAKRTENGRFECSFDYVLIQGTAEDVFFEHSLTPNMPANGEETYVLMPGLLYDGNRLTRPAPGLPSRNLPRRRISRSIPRSLRCQSLSAAFTKNAREEP